MNWKSRCLIFTALFLLLSFLWIPGSIAQSINPEPGFTQGDTNIISINDLSGRNKELCYGKRLEKFWPVIDTNPVFKIFTLNPDTLYYFKCYLNDGFNIDSTNVDSSYQDTRPPLLLSSNIDNRALEPSEINYFGKVAANTLTCSFSDEQTFYFYRHDPIITHWFDLDSIEASPGLSYFEIKRNDNSVFVWDHQDTTVSHPSDTTFQVNDILLQEGKFNFALLIKDATYNPNQSLGILGNVTTYNFSVVYDTTKPSLNFLHVKNLYTSRDLTADGTILLPIMITDIAAGIDLNSLNYHLSGSDSDRDPLGYSWSGDTLKIEVKFITDTHYTLTVSLADSCGNLAEGSKTFNVDLHPPALTSFEILDLGEQLPHLRAQPGFTDSVLVNLDNLRFSSVSDSLQADSLHCYGDTDTVIQYQAVISQFNLRSIFPNLQSSDSRIIRIAARDNAGNEQLFSTAATDTIVFDNIPPVLTSITLADSSSGDTTSTDERTVYVFPRWQSDAGIDSIYIFEDGDENGSIYAWTGQASYEFTLSPDYGLKTVHAWLRDRAGNRSEVRSDTIHFSNLPSVRLELKDPDTVVCDTALANYINNTTATIVITNSSNSPDSICFSGDTKWLTLPISAASLDLQELCSRLGNPTRDTLLEISYFALRNDGAHQQDTQTVTLHFDNLPPQITILTMRDTSNNPCSAQNGFTNDASVVLETTTPAADVCQIKTGFAADALGLCQSWSDRMTVVLPEREGHIAFFASIRDSAGNWSTVVRTSIYKDQTPPTLTIELQDYDTRDPNRTDNPRVRVHITAVSDSAFQMALNPVATDSIHQCADFVYPVTDTDGVAGLDNQRNVYFFYAAVSDSAGNVSAVTYDDIPRDLLALNRITLYDADDSTNDGEYRDSLYTNDESVIIVVNKAGQPTHYAVSEDSTALASNPVWQNYPGDTLKSTLSSLQGVQTVFLWLKDIITGKISEIKSNNIALDKTPPDYFAFNLQDTTTVNKLCSTPRELVSSNSSRWTNESRIWAIADSVHDMLSGIDSVQYNQSKFKYAPKILLDIPNEPNIFVVHGSVNDSAGNWRTTQFNAFIQYDSESPVMSLRDSRIDYSLNDPQVRVNFTVLQDTRALWQVVAAKNCCFTDDPLHFYPPNVDSISVPPSWAGEGWRYFIAADSAGNVSSVDSVYFHQIKPPELAITAFDYDEYFATPSYRDSLYSDELLVVLEITVLSGDLDSVKIWDIDPANTSSWIPKSALLEIKPNLYYANFNCSNLIAPAGYDIIYILAKDRLNETSALEQDTLLYNSSPPILEQFEIVALNGDQTGTAERKVIVRYCVAYDLPVLNSDLPLAAIVLSDSLTVDSIIPIQSHCGQFEFELSDHRGLQIISAYVLDAADIPQDGRAFPDEMEHHPSNVLCDSIRYNPVEVSNYPNPFNPLLEITQLLFYLNEESPVEISIFDPFGNLVDSWQTLGKKGFNDGHFDAQLCWDGKNGKDQIVANGGYICLIKPKSGEAIYRKIAVLKR